MRYILVYILIPVTAFAAYYEFDIYYGIGAPDFSFNNAPLSISIYPWEHFGFSSGIEYSKRKKSNNNENMIGNMTIIDNDNHEISFDYTMDKYKDELSTQLLSVPVLLKFRSKWFYSSAGVKLGIPQNVKVNVSYENFRTEAYLSHLNIRIDSLPHMGIGKFGDDSFTTPISAKLLLLLAFESGIRIKLSENFALLFGAFIDYSVNKGFDRGLPNVIEWVEHTDGALVNVNDGWRKWKPWSAGGVAKLQFGFKR
ncbi:MAG: hypothetical protein FWC15_06225 [Fibromonadales bacterium]|nr:hypothetical protein [Fibromonadales bacterium]